MTTTAERLADRADTERQWRDAEKDDIAAACQFAVRRTRRYFDADRVVDAAVNLVAGYAMAELHRTGMLAMPAKILEHARAALAEA